MKDPVSITFSTKAKHGLATSILNNEEIPFEYTNDTLSIRVEREDLQFSVMGVLGMAQIWPIKSFHGGPDYIVERAYTNTPKTTGTSLVLGQYTLVNRVLFKNVDVHLGIECTPQYLNSLMDEENGVFNFMPNNRWYFRFYYPDYSTPIQQFGRGNDGIWYLVDGVGDNTIPNNK